MNEASFDLAEIDVQMKACTSISSLTFTYGEIDIDGSDFFLVRINYPKHYRESKMIRAIDIQTLIGNAGGYIGLFLGKLIKIFVEIDICYIKHQIILEYNNSLYFRI